MSKKIKTVVNWITFNKKMKNRNEKALTDLKYQKRGTNVDEFRDIHYCKNGKALARYEKRDTELALLIQNSYSCLLTYKKIVSR
jgi:hypothetical protein